MGIFKKKVPAPPQERDKPFRIELDWRGMLGLVMVCFCLFLWMFLLGIWAGQTILLPAKGIRTAQSGEIVHKVPTKEAAEGLSPREPQRASGP